MAASYKAAVASVACNKQDVVCRSLALGLASIAACMGLLLAMPSSIIPLFAGRAASMSAFTVLYIFTPEVLPLRSPTVCLHSARSLLQHGPKGSCMASAKQLLRYKVWHVLEPDCRHAPASEVCTVLSFGTLMSPIVCTDELMLVRVPGIPHKREGFWFGGMCSHVSLWGHTGSLPGCRPGP